MKLRERNNVLEGLVVALRENHKELEDYQGISNRFDLVSNYKDVLPDYDKFKKILDTQQQLNRLQYKELDKISEAVLNPNKKVDIDEVVEDSNHSINFCYSIYIDEVGKEFPELPLISEISDLEIPSWARSNYHDDLEALKEKHERFVKKYDPNK